MIDTKQINELVKKYQKSEKNSSNLTKITEQVKEIQKEIEELKKPLDSEVKGLMENFIEVKKKSLKNEEDKQTKKQVRELKKQLAEKGLLEAKINDTIRYCEELVELEKQVGQEQLQAQIEIAPNK